MVNIELMLYAVWALIKCLCLLVPREATEGMGFNREIIGLRFGREDNLYKFALPF
jgi:hypothetical protein